ncbi:dienelactone hydrolase family protein [Pseudomonas asiatica]|uniref:dienelactone hydrolase family protein n=1 Tax=Pseudomonas TaxID=286 RepID=UPI001E2DFB06|nr:MULTISPECIES: dienelactone hydrolase family protein [Pseudomonas]UFH29308.1 dienelactone hydrolase family protein [Pseudomonas sp. CIP-10]WDM86381.1 dienelactone hydrolase family protein [Pseudomonas asiatica]
MSHWITMVTPHGPMNGWSAEPDDKPVGGVVLVHEFFGVNGDMRQIAERYAEDGYLTVVPALFDKIQREVELGYAPEDILLGSRLATEIGLETAAELVATTVDAIAHAGNVAIVGYGWGGAVALRAAQTLSAPCIVYGGVHDVFWPSEQSSIPILVHSSNDALGRESLLRDKALNLNVLTYPVESGFYRGSDAQRHQSECADLALRKSLEFLRAHIRGKAH